MKLFCRKQPREENAVQGPSPGKLLDYYVTYFGTIWRDLNINLDKGENFKPIRRGEKGTGSSGIKVNKQDFLRVDPENFRDFGIRALYRKEMGIRY